MNRELDRATVPDANATHRQSPVSTDHASSPLTFDRDPAFMLRGRRVRARPAMPEARAFRVLDRKSFAQLSALLASRGGGANAPQSHPWTPLSSGDLSSSCSLFSSSGSTCRFLSSLRRLRTDDRPDPPAASARLASLLARDLTDLTQNPHTTRRRRHDTNTTHRTQKTNHM